MEEIIYFIEKFLTFLPVPFLGAVNLSITAGWAVLAVILIRLIFRKAPKWLSCALWGIVALRLVLPFSLESVFSLIPSSQTIDPTMPYSSEFRINSGIAPLDNAVNTHYADTVPIADNTADITIVISCIWLLGVAVMLGFAFVSWARLRYSVRTATKTEGNIYSSEFVASPFVLGIFRPRIYIPYSMNEAELPLVIAHERAHISRRDYLIKPLGFLLLSIYWFNPLLWLAYVLLCRDIEAACDERVIKNFGEQERKRYSLALLNASISRKSIAVCPLAFGETGVKERIKGVMNYKKPAFWVVVAAVAVCAAAAVCLLTNPKNEETVKFEYTPQISQELDELIGVRIIEHNQGHYLDGMMSFEAHSVLATRAEKGKDSDKITVYIMALYQEYSVENGQLSQVSGGLTPAALTFTVEGDEQYALYEYWEPGMGTEYVSDLKENFPAGVDYDTQSYVEQLEADCRAQAVEYFGLDPQQQTQQQVSHEYSTKAVYTDYTLVVSPSATKGGTWLTDRDFVKNNGYHVFLYMLDECDVYVEGVRMYIGTALGKGIINGEEIVSKAESDAKAGRIKTEMLKDGGTRFYWYDNYTVIKRNALAAASTDKNKDLVIGPAQMSLSDYSAFVDFLSDTNAGDDYELAVNTPTSALCADTADDLPGAVAQIRISEAADETIYSLTDADMYKKYGYNVYCYSLSGADVVTADGKTYDMSSALNKGIVTPDLLVAAAKTAAVGTVQYDDGGSTLYVTENYALIRLNTIEGKRDIVIGPADMKFEGTINSFFNDEIGVTAAVGYGDGPAFDARVIENNGKNLLVEVTDPKDSGMQKGTQAYVSLNAVLTHIELPEMKKGDEIRIIFDGSVQETYPVQISTVWAVYDVK